LSRSTKLQRVLKHRRRARGFLRATEQMRARSKALCRRHRDQNQQEWAEGEKW
jgi:hypothetical protein